MRKCNYQELYQNNLTCQQRLFYEQISLDPRLIPVDGLMRDPYGITICEMSRILGMTEPECRAAIQDVLDLGGQVEVLKCKKAGLYFFRLDGYILRRRLDGAA